MADTNKILGMITECKICGSDRIENKELGLCASCSSRQRKFERDSKKLESKTQKKAAYKIPKISEKLKTALVDYKKLRIEHLKKHPDCQAKLIGCQNDRKTNQLHHLAKRGSNLNNTDFFMTVCIPCHSTIETKLSAATRREKGLLITPKP